MKNETYSEILSPKIGNALKLMIFGWGSGGSNLAMHLARTGFCNLYGVDFDKLETRNHYLHSCPSEYVGMEKVMAVKKLIHSFNPNCEIETISENIFEGEKWIEKAMKSDIIAICTDNEPSRHMLSDFCVENKIPFVAGKAFRKAIGGEIFRYVPGETGCLSCLKIFLENGRQDGITEVENLSGEELEQIYSQDVSVLKESPGLYLDTQFIPLLHARIVLDTAYRIAGKSEFPKIIANYLIWSNHCTPPLRHSLGIEKYLLRPQAGCLSCNGGAK